MRGKGLHGTMAGRDRGPAFSDPWLELRAAIVRQAAEDYIEILRRMWKRGGSIQDRRMLMKEKLELERFFYSRWYDCLCDVPPEKMISACINRAKELEKEAIERKNNQKIKEQMMDAI